MKVVLSRNEQCFRSVIEEIGGNRGNDRNRRELKEKIENENSSGIMTRRWKLKTNSSNILLVLITLILVKAEWVSGEDDRPGNSLEDDRVDAIVGNGEIAEYFFQASASNNSLILEGVNRCLENFQLVTCVKMLLLDRINDAIALMEEPEVARSDVRFLHGLLVFKVKNNTNTSGVAEENSGLTLDEEITAKVFRLFRRRSLLVNLLPILKVEIEPVQKRADDLVCFTYKFPKKEDSGEVAEGRKRKGGMPMMMIMPPLIMLGLMPFTLASLKAMVMNAVMINMMALNGAIFMTIRNLVFGPRKGDNVKYVNYGYSKDRQTQSKRPVLIIHSPAAFVKQPPVHKKPVHQYWPQQHFHKGLSFQQHDHEGNEEYYIVQENDVEYGSPHKRQGIQRRHFDANRRQQYKFTNSNQRIQNPRAEKGKNSSSAWERGPRPAPVHSDASLAPNHPGTALGTRKGPWREPQFKPSPQWDPINLGKP